MGQQQLLWLVLGIVVVGATVVAGAHVFGWEKQQLNHALAFQESLSIITDVQLWKIAPSSAGGGAEAVGFEDLTFQRLGYTHVLLSNRVHKTENGCYQLRTAGAAHHAVLMLSAPSCALKDYVAHVIVRGPNPGDLDWRYAPPSSFRLLR